MNRKDFDLDLKAGEEGERLLMSILREKTIEVKRDYLSQETGNIAIEIESRGQPSGIMTTKADYWAHLLEQEKKIVIFRTDKLKELVKESTRRISGGDDGTSVLVLLKKEDILC